MKRAAALTPAVAVAALAATVLAAPLPSFHVSAPAVIIDVNGHTLKGSPIQLVWGDKPGLFYIQTAQGYQPHVVFRHYTVTLGAKAPASLKKEPDWASKYWAWKSQRSTPADPTLIINVRKRVLDNRLPIESLADKARSLEGGGQQAMLAAENVANDRKNASSVQTLVLKNTIIGQYFDSPLLPGLTFGWSPKELHAVAYVDTHNRLAIYDYLLDRNEVVTGTSGVLLPAWSLDGTKIVFLQKTGKKAYSLEQVSVTRQ